MNHQHWRRFGIISLLALTLGVQAAHNTLVRTQARASPSGTAHVSIVRVTAGAEAAVRQAVALVGGLNTVISPGDVVVIKPNMVMDASIDQGMVTDPAVVRAVVRLAWEAGASQVIIAEGTAQYRTDPNRDRFCTQSAFRAAGYDLNGDMVDDVTGVPLVDLNDSGGTDMADPAKVRRVTLPYGLIRTEYWLPNLILDADVLISVPVLKNHFIAGVTLGMKNMLGVLPNDLYHASGNVYGKHSLSHSSLDLARHIVDVNLARRPDFVVVDGQRGMVDGPVGSQVMQPPMGLILAGRDVVAVDTVGTLVMGYDPHTIPYLDLAAQSGLGVADVARIHVVGVPVAQARRDFPAPYAVARRADAQPPTIAITMPSEGEAVADGVTVDVEAHDEAVARVELYLDGQWMGEVAAPPYRFTLDLSQHAPGPHTLQAVAYDRFLNQSEAVRRIQLVGSPPTSTSLPPTPSPFPPTATEPVPSTPSPTSSPTFPPPTASEPAPLVTSPTPSPFPPTATEPVPPAASPTPTSPPPTPLPPTATTYTARNTQYAIHTTSPPPPPITPIPAATTETDIAAASSPAVTSAPAQPRTRWLLLGTGLVLGGGLMGLAALWILWKRK